MFTQYTFFVYGMMCLVMCAIEYEFDDYKFNEFSLMNYVQLSNQRGFV